MGRIGSHRAVRLLQGGTPPDTSATFVHDLSWKTAGTEGVLPLLGSLAWCLWCTVRSWKIAGTEGVLPLLGLPA